MGNLYQVATCVERFIRMGHGASQWPRFLAVSWDKYCSEKGIITLYMNSLGIYLIVKLDTLERLENTLAITEYLATNFKANIYLWEIAPYQNDILENLLPGKVK